MEPQGNKNTALLHEQLVKDNYAVPADLKTFEDTFNDPKNAKSLFDQLKTDNYAIPEDYDSFVNTFGLKKKDYVSELSSTILSKIFGDVAKTEDETKPEDQSAQGEPVTPKEFKTPDLSLKSPEFKGFEATPLTQIIGDTLAKDRISLHQDEITQKAKDRIAEIDKEIAALPKPEIKQEFYKNQVFPESPEETALKKERDMLEMATTKPDAIGYIFGKAYANSIIGLADRISNKEEGQAMQDWLKKYDAGTLTDATATALGFMFDAPFFGFMGKVGGKIGQLAAKPIVDKAMTKGVQKLVSAGIEKPLAEKLVLKGAQKIAQGIAGATSSGVALGSYSGVSDALSQWAQPDADFEDIKWNNVLKTTGKNTLLGYGVGGLGLASSALAQKASAIGNTALRVGAKIGTAAGGLTAESALFAYGGALLDGKSPKEVSQKDFISTMALLGILKGTAIAQKPGEAITNIYKSLKFDPQKPGYGQFAVDITPEEINSLNFAEPETYTSAMKKLSKDDGKLAEIIQDENVPALLKQKILWGARGVAMPGVNLSGDKVVPNGNSVDILNKEGTIVDRETFSSKQEADQKTLEIGLQLEDNKMQARSAEPDVDRVKIVSQLQAKGVDTNKLLTALDKPVADRMPEESKMVGDYYSLIPKPEKKKEGEPAPGELMIGDRTFASKEDLFKHLDQVALNKETGAPDSKWFDRELDAWPGPETVKAINEWTEGKLAEAKAKREALPKEKQPKEATTVVSKEFDKNRLLDEVKSYNELTASGKKKNASQANTIRVNAQNLGFELQESADGFKVMKDGKAVKRTPVKVNKEKVESQKLLTEHEPDFQKYVNDVFETNPNLYGVMIGGLSNEQRAQAFRDIQAGKKTTASSIALNELNRMYKEHGGIDVWNAEAQQKVFISNDEIQKEIESIKGSRVRNTAEESFDEKQAYEAGLLTKSEYDEITDYNKRADEQDRIAEENFMADQTGNSEVGKTEGVKRAREIEKVVRDEGYTFEVNPDLDPDRSSLDVFDSEKKPVSIEDLPKGIKDLADEYTQLIHDNKVSTDERQTEQPNPPVSKGEENNLPGGAETTQKPVIGKGAEKPIRSTDPAKQKQIEAIDKEYDAKIFDAQKELSGMDETARQKVIDKATAEINNRNTIFGDANAVKDGVLKPGDQGFEVSRKPIDEALRKFDERKVELTKQVDALNKERESKIGEVLKQQTLGFKEPAKVEPSGSLGSATRFRPKERVDFKTPLVGPSGAKLVSYEWAWKPEEKFDKREGEAKAGRVSDWDRALSSAETGRDVVHQFLVEMPDGSTKLMSAESALNVLGFTEKAQSKNMPSLISASKTLAKNQMELATKEAQNKDYNEAKAKIESEPYPEITRTIEPNDLGVRWHMGETSVREMSHGKELAEKIDPERLYALKSSYVEDKLKGMGLKSPYGLGDLRARVERQKKKIDEILSQPEKETNLNDAVSKYGWSAVKNPEGFWLQNKKGQPVVQVVVNEKKGTYKFLDMSGTKLMDGRGQIEKSAEKLLKDFYYAQETKINEIGGYKFTNTSTLTEADGLSVKPMTKEESKFIGDNLIFNTPDKKSLKEGVEDLGNGWYTGRGTDNSKVLYNEYTKESVELSHSKGGRMGTVLNDFVKNNPREVPKVETPVTEGEFKYKMLLRPFDVGTYPKEGFVKAENDPNGGHQILTFNRKLTPAEWSKWDFSPITETEALKGKEFVDKSGDYSKITLDFYGNGRGANVSMYDKEGNLVEEPFGMTTKEIMQNIESGYWTEKKADQEIEFAKRPDGALKTKNEYTPEEWQEYTKSVIDKKLSELPKQSKETSFLYRVAEAYNKADNDFDRNRAIDDYVYSLAGDRNKDVRQSLMQFMTGTKVSKADSGISRVKAEVEKFIKKANETQTEFQQGNNLGVKFKDKTYQSVDQVQDALANGDITFEEQKPLIEQVRKFEDGLKSGAKKVSDNIGSKLDKGADDMEKKIQDDIKDENSKLYLKMFPDVISKANTILYEKLRPLRDALANNIAQQLEKGVKSQTAGIRWATKSLTNLYNGLVRTQADMHGSGLIGHIGKLEMMGTTKTYAPHKAGDLLNAWRDIVNADPESLERVWRVLDPELANVPGETPLQYGDLSTAEKNLFFELKDWNTWTHETNYANGFIPTATYLKYKDVTGNSNYIARMYDKFEIDPFTSPEVQQFLERGNNAYTSKIITDYMKARKELTGIIEHNGKMYDTVESLKQGLDNGEMSKEEYQAYKDKIGSDEWRREHSIKDPTYLTAKRVMQTIQNVAIKQYMDQIIDTHPDYVRTLKKGEEIPKGFTKLSSSYSWGPFRNKVVANHIVEDFIGFFYANGLVNTAYDVMKAWDRTKLNQFYKKYRTVYNPFVQTGNVTGNVFFASINGINPGAFLKGMVEAGKLHTKDPALFDKLLKSGLIGDTGITGEMKPLDVLNAPTGKLGKLDEFATKAYVGADNLAKISAYQIFRRQGMTHENAVRRAYDAFQNYATVGKTWDISSKIPLIGPTFVKFQADLQRILVNNMLTTPLTTIGTLMMVKMLGNLSSALSGETEEEQKVRESRKGVAKIPFVNIPLSFKIGKSEVNVARYLSPLYLYNRGDSEMELSELSKFMPIQFQQKEEDKMFPMPAFADATWGWLGSVYTDKDFRGMSIADPTRTKFTDPNTPTDVKIGNILDYIARSQIPFYKGATDIYKGATGQLDYYGRKRNWYQAIINNVVKIQQFDKPELKNYVERNLNYLTSKYASLATKMGDAQAVFYRTIKDAEDKGLNPEVQKGIYESASKLRDKSVEKSLNEQIPVYKELERLTEVYKKWHPEDPFLQENYQNIESGKNQVFNVKDIIDFQKKYPSEFTLLKKNDILKRPDIPKYYQGVALTDAERKTYSETYWSEYLRNMDSMVGLTPEDIADMKQRPAGKEKADTPEGFKELNLLNIKASEAASRANREALKNLRQ